MKHPELQAREVSPLDDLEIPTYRQPGNIPDLKIHEYNRQAGEKLNDARREWQLRCLCAITDTEEVGEIELEHLGDPAAQMAALIMRLDPAKLNLTKRPVMTGMIAVAEISPEKDQKAVLRHAGDLLTLTYDGITIGTFEASYNHDGTIELAVKILDIE